MTEEVPLRFGVWLEHRRCPATVATRIPKARAVGVGDEVPSLCWRRERRTQLGQPGGEFSDVVGAVGSHVRPSARRAFSSRIFSYTLERKPACSKSANHRSGMMNG